MDEQLQPLYGAWAAQSPPVAATILAALGLDNERLTFSHAGRDEMLTRTEGTGSIIPGALQS